MRKENRKNKLEIHLLNLFNLAGVDKKTATKLASIGIEIIEEDVICQLLEKQREDILEKISKVIQTRLDYCQKQNGLPYCKNCGLCEEDLENLKEKLKN